MESNSLGVLRASFDLPLLTEEQEIALFRQFKAGGPNAQEAREKIILHNIRLVRSVAGKMYLNFDMEDKIQWGIIGLNEALVPFDLGRRRRFSTYATPWIRQVISREAGCYSSFGFSLPAHVLGDLGKLIKLVKREGIEPSVELIVNHPEMAKTVEGERVKLGIAHAETLLELYTKHRHPASLDQEVAQSNGTMGGKLGDFIPDQHAESAFDPVINSQNIISLLDCLDTRQLLVVTLRYLSDDQSVKLISDQIGTSAQTVRNILAASLALMRRRADELKIEFP